MDKNKNKNRQKRNRAYRVRKKILGTAEKPRLSVNRSLSNISAQLIDDLGSGKGKILDMDNLREIMGETSDEVYNSNQ